MANHNEYELNNTLLGYIITQYFVAKPRTCTRQCLDLVYVQKLDFLLDSCPEIVQAKKALGEFIVPSQTVSSPTSSSTHASSNHCAPPPCFIVATVQAGTHSSPRLLLTLTFARVGYTWNLDSSDHTVASVLELLSSCRFNTGESEHGRLLLYCTWVVQS